MSRNTHDVGNGRSAVPLSLALLVVNALAAVADRPEPRAPEATPQTGMLPVDRRDARDAC